MTQVADADGQCSVSRELGRCQGGHLIGERGVGMKWDHSAVHEKVFPSLKLINLI